MRQLGKTIEGDEKIFIFCHQADRESDECQGINRIKLLEKSLSEFDETAIYTFCAGNINKMEEDD